MLRMNSPENVLLSLLEMDKGIDINRLKQAVANAIKIHPILFTRIERGAGTEAFLLPAKEKCEIPEIPVIEVTEEEIPALRERLARELAAAL
jgi:NRPS condensation-like uncharacterized protein